MYLSHPCLPYRTTLEKLNPPCPPCMDLRTLSSNCLGVSVRSRAASLLRILRVRVHEQKLQTVHAAADAQHGFPVFAKDVQAHVAVVVQVGMVDSLRALHLGGLVRVHLWDDEVEDELSALVVSLVGLNGHPEVHQLILAVGELDGHGGRQGELGDVLRQADLAGALLGARRARSRLCLGLLLLLVLRTRE